MSRLLRADPAFADLMPTWFPRGVDKDEVVRRGKEMAGKALDRAKERRRTRRESRAAEHTQEGAERAETERAEAQRRQAAKDMKKKAKVEYRRTCSRCSTHWYVPPAVAAREPGLSKVETGGILLGGAKGAVVARMAQERNKKLVDESRCPNCGSSAFSQMRVPLA